MLDMDTYVRNDLRRTRSVVLHDVIINICMRNVWHDGPGDGAREKREQAANLGEFHQ